MKNKIINIGALRVWHIQNPPSAPTYYDVEDTESAGALIDKLATADLKRRDVTSNAFGLEEWDGKEWSEYYDNEGRDIDDIMRDECGQ